MLCWTLQIPNTVFSEYKWTRKWRLEQRWPCNTILSVQIRICEWGGVLHDQNLCSRELGHTCPLTTVWLEFGSISRLEEQNELLDKTFPNAASRSRLLCACVAKSKGHWTRGQKVLIWICSSLAVSFQATSSWNLSFHILKWGENTTSPDDCKPTLWNSKEIIYLKPCCKMLMHHKYKRSHYYWYNILQNSKFRKFK